MARSPLSIAVPLDGTDHEIGLNQLEYFVRRKKTLRAQYRRFRGPFVEYLTFNEIRGGIRDWKHFLHCSVKDIRLGLNVYTIPGSILALSERIDENLATSMVLSPTTLYTKKWFIVQGNYLYLIELVVLLSLGPVFGILLYFLLSSYCWLRETLPTEKSELSRQVKSGCVEYGYPVLGVLVCLLTPLGVRISSGMLMGVFVVFLHASLHRAPSEFRYARQNRVVRWIRRGRATSEGSQKLWRDFKKHIEASYQDWSLSLQWYFLRVRDYFGLWRLTLLHKMKTKAHRKKAHLVKNSQ